MTAQEPRHRPDQGRQDSPHGRAASANFTGASCDTERPKKYFLFFFIRLPVRSHLAQGLLRIVPNGPGAARAPSTSSLKTRMLALLPIASTPAAGAPPTGAAAPAGAAVDPFAALLAMLDGDGAATGGGLFDEATENDEGAPAADGAPVTAAPVPALPIILPQIDPQYAPTPAESVEAAPSQPPQPILAAVAPAPLVATPQVAGGAPEPLVAISDAAAPSPARPVGAPEPAAFAPAASAALPPPSPAAGVVGRPASAIAEAQPDVGPADVAPEPLRSASPEPARATQAEAQLAPAGRTVKPTPSGAPAATAPVAAPPIAEPVQPPTAPVQPSPTPVSPAGPPQGAMATGAAPAPAQAAAAPRPQAAAKPVGAVAASVEADESSAGRTAASAVSPLAPKPAAPPVQPVAAVPASPTLGEPAVDPSAAEPPVDRPPEAPAAASRPETTAAPAAPAPVRGSPETVARLAAEIVRKLEGQTTRFEIELTPAGLGKVEVRIEIAAHGQVAAAMSFDNPQAAADLRARANELQRALEQAGFTLAGGLSFDVAGEQRQQQQNEQPAADAAHRGRAFQAALDALDAPESPPPVLRRWSAQGLDIRI